MDILKKIRENSEEVLSTLEKHGNILGKGSSRICFLIDNTNVCKFALNENGKEQNIQEGDFLTTHKNNDLFIPLVDYDKTDGRWIIVKKAEPISSEKFKSYFGENCHTLLYSLIFDYEKFKSKYIKFLFTNKNIKKLHEIYLSLDDKEVINDAIKLENWGIYNNKPVIIDCGLSEHIYKKYYSVEI